MSKSKLSNIGLHLFIELLSIEYSMSLKKIYRNLWHIVYIICFTELINIREKNSIIQEINVVIGYSFII